MKNPIHKVDRRAIDSRPQDTSACLRRGFTLIELLVVIVIVAALSALALMATKRATVRANATAEMSNLRQVGLMMTSVATDLGYYPLEDPDVPGSSWADVIVNEVVGKDSSITQTPVLWSPLMVKNIPENEGTVAITHFGANPVIFPPGDDAVRKAQIRRASEQVLLASATPITSGASFKKANPFMDKNSLKLPDSMSKGNANSKLGLSANLGDSEHFGAQPDFFRGQNGKANFLFADGHVEGLGPHELKQRHFAITY